MPLQTPLEKPPIRLADKWGEAAYGGFFSIPDVLLKNQNELELKDGELVVLLNVLMHWWYRDKYPFPRSTTIARRMGVSMRTVQRALSRLEELNLLCPISDDQGGSYLSPEPLVARLEILVKKDPDYLVRRRGSSDNDVAQ